MNFKLLRTVLYSVLHNGKQVSVIFTLYSVMVCVLFVCMCMCGSDVCGSNVLFLTHYLEVMYVLVLALHLASVYY